LKKCFFRAIDDSSVFVNIVSFVVVFGLINESIAQKQGTGTTKEVLKASQG
jgi:hypothetical protein